ncbi:hypothetical protein [Bacillus sp. WLY-B-L8]|uniref:hypothetical protein n=1 Tax=Bacillus multifaciens TaxID=3068506 RepID=UPI00288E0CF9|nr:hypothetical protein [Bacillus pseudomycoides]
MFYNSQQLYPQQPYYQPYPEQQLYYPYHYDPRFPQTGPTTPTEPTEQQIQQYASQFQHLKQPVLNLVKPWVEYGVKEAKHTSVPHAMTEIAAITYLIGKGVNPTVAHYIVESWEKNEQF